MTHVDRSFGILNVMLIPLFVIVDQRLYQIFQIQNSNHFRFAWLVNIIGEIPCMMQDEAV